MSRLFHSACLVLIATTGAPAPARADFVGTCVSKCDDVRKRDDVNCMAVLDDIGLQMACYNKVKASRDQCAAVCATQHPELRWFRTAAERKAAYAQAYAYAKHLVTRNAPAGAWAVVLDADETVLDNSEYQDWLASSGQTHTESLWNAWVREKKAVAFPPARDFIEFVHKQGGKVAIVTNRSEAVCEHTRQNFEAQHVSVDAILCAPAGSSDKQPRFDKVASGRAFNDGKTVNVKLFIGDDIRDCPKQTQAQFDTKYFGDSCLVLPDPMYGSWASNPYP